MIGGIIGDICGSIYEYNPVMAKEDIILMIDGVRFTDDTILTVAVADSIMNNKDLSKTLIQYVYSYPLRGYGMRFQRWIWSKTFKPYGSYGNGSAMRVSSIGYYYNTIDEVLDNAKKSAEVTHNHIEGIKGAQAVALAIFLARSNNTKEEIKKEITLRFGYNLNNTVDNISKEYNHNETCQVSVPEAIIAFLESTDFESAIINAIWLRGDADTQACIAGSIAEAYYKEIPQYLKDKAYQIIPSEFKKIIDMFCINTASNIIINMPVYKAMKKGYSSLADIVSNIDNLEFILIDKKHSISVGFSHFSVHSDQQFDFLSLKCNKDTTNSLIEYSIKNNIQVIENSNLVQNIYDKVELNSCISDEFTKDILDIRMILYNAGKLK